MNSKAEETVSEAALALPPEQRGAYLDRHCGGNTLLRQRVEALLQARESAGEFLAEPAASPPGGAVRVSASLSEKPGDKIGHYKLLQEIAEGGCGVVYMAEQQEPIRRKVAFKVIKLGMDTKAVIARFEAERQALALMDHPNIARVLDAGATDTGRPYFVMELVRGIRITDYCDQNNLPTEARLNLFLQVCHAIQHAHQKGIIHRDIKPSNILVTVNDGVPVPKVIDFGIAKATGGQVLTDKTLFTAFEQFIGTPAYMSPEQAEMTSLDIDTRSDIYALGVFLYELLTGHTPFDPATLASAGLDQMRRIIREKEPPRPSDCLSSLDKVEQTTLARRHQSEPPKLIHQVRGDLDWIVMKCLEKDRTRRYETANDLAMDVARHMQHEPVVARPPTARYRLSRLVRRHRLEAGVAAAFVGLLVVATILSGVLAVRANRERQRAVRAQREAAEKAAEAKAVLAFFQDKILAAARPAGQAKGLGTDVTVRRAVEAAAAEITASFTNKPLVEAAIRHSLGITFDYLGDYSNAAVQLEQALLLRKTYLGLDQAEAFASMNGLANVYRQLKQPRKAIELNEQALQLRRAKLGPDAPATLLSMVNLASAYRAAGRLQQALPLNEEALRRAKLKLGQEDELTLLALNSLASAYRQAGRLTEAMPLLEQTVALRKATLGPDNPATLLSQSDLARTYLDLGRMTEATASYEEILRLRRIKLGPDHPETIQSVQNLSWAYQLAGRYAEALPLLEQVSSWREAKLGRTHPETIDALASLGNAYLTLGRLPEAYSQLQEGLSRAQSLGPTHRLNNLLTKSIILYYAKKGDLAESARWQRQFAERLRAAPEPKDPLELNNLAWGLATSEFAGLRDGRTAIAYAEKAVQASNRKEPMFLDTLAAAYAEAGDFARAVSAQQEAIGLVSDPIKKTDYIPHLRLYESRIPYHDDAGLGDWTYTLLAGEKFAQAEASARECLALRQVQRPDDWLTFNARSMVGASLLGQKKYADAEPLLLAGCEGMQKRADKIPADGKVRLAEALQRVVQLYEATGRADQAAEWKKKLATAASLQVPTVSLPPLSNSGTTNATGRAPKS